MNACLFFFACIYFASLVLAPPALAQPAPKDTADAPWQVEFLTPASAADNIAASVNDAFLGKLYPREVATMTGTPQVDQTAEDSREFARTFFRNAVLEFTEQEVQAVRTVVAGLDEQFGERYPLLVRRRWSFIKTRADLCGGFSFTRGSCIILSEPTARAIERSRADTEGRLRAEEILLHEQIHVLQREQPELFRPLYEDICGFRHMAVSVSTWFNERQISNPDGEDENWIVEVPSEDGTRQAYWIGTLLEGDRLVHRMGHDFNTVAVRLQETDLAYVMSDQDDARPGFTSLAEMPSITSRLPLPPVYDHVNEIGAYLFTSITHQRPPHPPSLSTQAAEVLERSKVWFVEHLNPSSE